jgi:elongation factor P
MPKASDLKPGKICEIDGKQYFVKNVEVKSPSARGASTLYKIQFNELHTKQKYEQTFKGDDMVGDVDFQNRNVSFLYQDGDQFTFMDAEDYSQYTLNEGELGDQAAWLQDGMEGLVGMIVNDNFVGIQLPQSVVKTVIETAPRMKGATASKSAKPATVDGGLTVMVPEYVETGEKIQVNTSTKEFMSRV